MHAMADFSQYYEFDLMICWKTPHPKKKNNQKKKEHFLNSL